MALKMIMLRSKKERAEKRGVEIVERLAELEKREAELERAVEETTEETPDEEKEELERAIDELIEEKEKLEKEKADIEAEIEKIEAEIDAEEKKIQQGAGSDPANDPEPRNKGGKAMATRKKFFGMSVEERTAFIQNEHVSGFLTEVRKIGKAGEQRSVTGAELTIPTEILELIRENILNYSKLMRRVRLVSVSGEARQPVMGYIPEAVWTEACAKLNELNFVFNEVEVEGYKVGGYVFMCNATLEDSDIDLAAVLIESIGQAIGIAVDKAILFGTGVRMPLGIATRLAQTAQPSNYPANARPWEDLHESNVVTIGSDKTGIEFYKELVMAGGKAKGRYARGEKFWAMNENTYTKIKVEAMSTNMAGLIVAGVDGTMPVAGGAIEVLSEDIIPDNTIIAGFGDLYLLAERAGAQLKRDDSYRFIEDQAAFRGTARYDGKPVIAEAFVAIGLGSAPVTSVAFATDTANDATLQRLTLGTESLSPSFDPTKYAYTVTASGDSAAVVATPTVPGAKVEITYDGKTVVNGATVTFEEGTKDLVVTVKNGNSSLAYTVSITKAGE